VIKKDLWTDGQHLISTYKLHGIFFRHYDVDLFVGEVYLSIRSAMFVYNTKVEIAYTCMN